MSMERRSWVQYGLGRTEILAAVMTIGLVLAALLLASLGRKDSPEPVDWKYVKEISTIVDMIASAPMEGDFEILYPSRVSEKDATIMRVNGKTSAVLRDLEQGDCQYMAQMATKGPFDFVIIEQVGKRTIYEVGEYDHHIECEGGARKLELIKE